MAGAADQAGESVRRPRVSSIEMHPAETIPDSQFMTVMQ